jgi:hypothetical protein
VKWGSWEGAGELIGSKRAAREGATHVSVIQTDRPRGNPACRQDSTTEGSSMTPS